MLRVVKIVRIRLRRFISNSINIHNRYPADIDQRKKRIYSPKVWDIRLSSNWIVHEAHDNFKGGENLEAAIYRNKATGNILHCPKILKFVNVDKNIIRLQFLDKDTNGDSQSRRIDHLIT